MSDKIREAFEAWAMDSEGWRQPDNFMRMTNHEYMSAFKVWQAARERYAMDADLLSQMCGLTSGSIPFTRIMYSRMLAQLRAYRAKIEP